MRQTLEDHLRSIIDLNEDRTTYRYSENINNDALNGTWLDNRTSYIYKVAVLCAIDSNKCDWAHIVIGTQRTDYSQGEVKGVFSFNQGENDDIGRVISRAFDLIKLSHHAFD